MANAVPPVGFKNQSMVVPIAGDTVPEIVNAPGPVLAAPVVVAIMGNGLIVPLIGIV